MDSLIAFSLLLEKILNLLNVFLVCHYLFSFFFFLLLWRPQVNFLVMKEKKKKKSCLSVCTVHYTRKETLSPNMRYSHPLEYSKKYWVILCIWRQIFFFFLWKKTSHNQQLCHYAPLTVTASVLSYR